MRAGIDDRWIRNFVVGASLVLALGIPVARAQASVQNAQAEPPAAAATAPASFAGFWDYNPDESVDIVTGRPEQNPRGPVVRPPAPAGRGAASGRERGSLFPPSPEMMRENREMSRDLLEVPETLHLTVSDGAITMVDDLERTWTFPTDGSRQRYRLSAVEFSARVQWEGNRLRREVEGDYGFRMSEVYFLSPDASRLFVIVRVGEPVRGRYVAGFDRVYDRVDPLP